MKSKSVILNAAEDPSNFVSNSILTYSTLLSDVFNSKMKNSILIHIFEPKGGADSYAKVEKDPDYLNKIRDPDEKKAETLCYSNYLKKIKTIANNIKDADKIFIMGHSNKTDTKGLSSRTDRLRTVEHIVNILKETNKERDKNNKNFKISLVACEGINVGRNLITKMQEAGIYGIVTARNHTVTPDPFRGKKYNVPKSGKEQNKKGDYKRILVATDKGCKEFKVNENGKAETTALSLSPKENLKRYEQISEIITQVAQRKIRSERLFELYPPAQVFEYLFENPGFIHPDYEFSLKQTFLEQFCKLLQ